MTCFTLTSINMTLRLLHEVITCARTINITNYKTIHFILKKDLNFFIIFIFLFLCSVIFFLVSSDIVLHVHSSSPNVKKNRSVNSFSRWQKKEENLWDQGTYSCELCPPYRTNMTATDTLIHNYSEGNTKTAHKSELITSENFKLFIYNFACSRKNSQESVFPCVPIGCIRVARNYNTVDGRC